MKTPSPTTPAPDGSSALALTPEQVAALLSRAGRFRVTADMVRRDLAAGAPTNPDGSINLVSYTAWLIREHTGGD